MRSDYKGISLIKMQENVFMAVKFSKISRGEYPRPPLELRPPVLVLWGTSLFPSNALLSELMKPLYFQQLSNVSF